MWSKPRYLNKSHLTNETLRSLITSHCVLINQTLDPIVIFNAVIFVFFGQRVFPIRPSGKYFYRQRRNFERFHNAIALVFDTFSKITLLIKFL